MKFYEQSFKKLIRNCKEQEQDSSIDIRNESYKYQKNIDTLTLFKVPFTKLIVKEQYVIKNEDDYYIARDILTNTNYMCFKNLMMIDIDIQKINDNVIVTDDFIINHFGQLKNLTFDIYKTSNGYHVFCVSDTFDYTNLDTIKFMLDHYGDFYYCLYAHIRGWCVRLNRKMEEFIQGNSQIYKYISRVGNKPVNNRLLHLINLHYTLSKKYSKSTPCK
jgi:acetyltransferase-like isoleucine patch superfamily enzyme